MRILILSDNHYKNLDDLNLDEFDYVIHAGDYGLSLDDLNNKGAFYVKGNCDVKGLNESTFKIGDRKIYLTHGHIYDVKYDYIRLMFKGLSINADYVIFGHTHRADMFIQEGVAFINPGAYKDGYYAIATDDDVSFYKDNKVYKQFRRKW